MKKNIFLVTTLSTLVVLGGCGSTEPESGFDQSAQEQEFAISTDSDEVSEIVETKIEEPEIDLMKDEWITYKNDKYGFSFEYPKSLGEVIITEYDNSQKTPNWGYGDCEPSGYSFKGKFTNATKGNLTVIDFGARSKSYTICIPRGGGLWDITEINDFVKDNAREVWNIQDGSLVYYDVFAMGSNKESRSKDLFDDAIIPYTFDDFGTFAFFVDYTKEKEMYNDEGKLETRYFNELNVNEELFKKIVTSFSSPYSK